jgi:hypothetical protein
VVTQHFHFGTHDAAQSGGVHTISSPQRSKLYEDELPAARCPVNHCYRKRSRHTIGGSKLTGITSVGKFKQFNDVVIGAVSVTMAAVTEAGQHIDQVVPVSPGQPFGWQAMISGTSTSTAATTRF